MSSTNRGADRHISDYYVTPVHEISKFWDKFKEQNNIENITLVLDPAAGGDIQHVMSYPEALHGENFKLITIDSRDDSLAEIIENYLDITFDTPFDLIITNPPFALGLDFVEKALRDVKDGGYVIMLLRLNFFGSKARNEWLKENMPYEVYVHSKRMSFTDNGKTDSIEYAHFVWKKGYNPESTRLYLLDYE